MKKLIALPILAVAGLLVPAAAFATPQSAALASPMLALPTPSAPTTRVISCADRLEEQLAKMQAPNMANNLKVYSTLLVGEMAYAESCGNSTGFCDPAGSAAYSGADLVGTSRVGKPSTTERSSLGFRITAADGTAKVKWSFKGKNYTGTVKACSNGYWTATSATSAIAIKLGTVQPVPS